MRTLCSPTSILIVAELVPGSVNHFEADGRSDQAARRIINASNFVSVHYYGDGSESDLEWRSLMGWFNRAGYKKFVVGELGICNNIQSTDRYPMLRSVLIKLRDRGVKAARIWQLLKDETGHIDPCSFDTARWIDITPYLRQDGFLP